MVCVQLIAGNFPGVSLRPSSRFRNGTRLSLAAKALGASEETGRSGNGADAAARDPCSSDAGEANELGDSGDASMDLGSTGTKQAVRKPEYRCSKCKSRHPQRYSNCERCGTCYHHRNLKLQKHHQQGLCARGKRQRARDGSAHTPKQSSSSKSRQKQTATPLPAPAGSIPVRVSDSRGKRCKERAGASHSRKGAKAAASGGSSEVGGSNGVEGGAVSVQELKKMGNGAMRCMNFGEAIKLYTKAILLCTAQGGEGLEVLYANRSSAYHTIGRMEEALADAENCILLDNSGMGQAAKTAALFGLNRSTEATDSSFVASRLGGEGGAHAASARCDSGSGISTSPSVMDGGLAASGQELAGAGEGAAGDVNLKWSGWQQELVHQTPQPPQSAKPTNWGSWRKKTAVYSLKEMIIDPCSNHLLIDTRSKEDFDRSHAWTAIEVCGFGIF